MSISPGIHDGLPFANYLAITAANASALKTLATCPAKLGIEREQSGAMRLGTLAHCALLEPAALELRYAATDLDRRGTKAWDAAELAAAGRELVKRAEWDEARAMRDAVQRHPTARALLEGATTERTLVWIDEETGVACKARLDALSPLGGPVDLKTAADASPYGWRKSAERLMYHIQAAHYLAGCRTLGLHANSMPFIVVESVPPYVVEVYPLSAHTVLEGERQRQELLLLWTKYAGMPAADRPGYTGQPFTEIEFSEFALSRSYAERVEEI